MEMSDLNVPGGIGGAIGYITAAVGGAIWFVRVALRKDRVEGVQTQAEIDIIARLSEQLDSRPRVSNDNAYAEALFRTAKYCPLWPKRPFDTLQQAREWVHRFVHWYNEAHCHSGLKYVTPNQRHLGEAPRLLAQRTAVYQAARERHPQRWSTGIRDWDLAPVVYLNPERAATEPRQYRQAA